MNLGGGKKGTKHRYQRATTAQEWAHGLPSYYRGDIGSHIDGACDGSCICNSCSVNEAHRCVLQLMVRRTWAQGLSFFIPCCALTCAQGRHGECWLLVLEREKDRSTDGHLWGAAKLPDYMGYTAGRLLLEDDINGKATKSRVEKIKEKKLGEGRRELSTKFSWAKPSLKWLVRWRGQRILKRLTEMAHGVGLRKSIC